MNWYLAKMVFRIVCGDGNHTAQFDEQLRLISAGSKEEAFHKQQECDRSLRTDDDRDKRKRSLRTHMKPIHTE